MTVYIETSAAVKLIVDEAESVALGKQLNDLRQHGVPIVSSMLTVTELRRTAVRAELSQAVVSDVLNQFDVFDLEHPMFVEAGLLPGKYLRSLDALHIAAAVRAEADSMLAYDVRLAESARAVGLQVIAPE